MAINAGDVVWNIGADITGLDRALNKAQKSIKGLGKQLGVSSRQIGMGMTAAGAAITGALGLALNKSLEFSKAMAEVNTLGIADLEGLGDAVKDVSAKFGLDLVEASNAAYQAISAGAAEAETPLLLESAAIAATAGVTGLTTAIELGTGVSNAFGIEFSKMSTVFDKAFVAVKGGGTTFDELGASIGKLSPIMAAAGLSVDEMFASIGALTTGGIATSEAVTGMKAIMQGILKPTSDAAAMASELGIQFDITALQTQGLGGFMQTLGDATGGNIDKMGAFFSSTEALNAALALTGNTAGTFNELLAEMDTSVGASQEAFDAFVEANPGFAFEQLKATLAVLAVEIGDELAPLLSQLAEDITPIIKDAIAWVKANQPLVGTIVKVAAVIGGLMLVLGPLLIILPGLIAAWGLLTAAAGIVATAIGLISIPIVATGVVIAALVLAVGLAVAFIVSKWDWLRDKTSQAWNGIKNAMGRAIDFMKDKIGWITNPIEGLIGLLTNLWELMKKTGQGGGGMAAGGVVGNAAGGTVKGYASGGATGHRIIEVGERGRELLAAPVGSRVLSHPDMMKAAGRGAGNAGATSINASFNIDASGIQDPVQFFETLKPTVHEWLRDGLRDARQ
jgi:TP901 family phage tail tape measure protein